MTHKYSSFKPCEKPYIHIFLTNIMRVRYEFSSRHTGHIENINKQRKKFPDIVTEIINISDIILEVLDARFIYDTRNRALEKEVERLGKKLIYVLNKSDLVDLEKKKKELKELKLYPYVLVSCNKRKGARELRTKIKIEAKRVELPHDKMKRVQIGIVGYPNTGKSSLINLLSGKNSAKVGAEAGFTKVMQKIKLTDDILILDTPGVIPAEEYSHHKPSLIAKHAKISARDANKVRRPDIVIQKLVDDFGEQLEKHYKVKVNGDGDLLIEEVGKKMNLLKKGGVVDENRAAKFILTEWQAGKIKI
jgi:ribosome biogenesis GTPase A